MDRKCLPCLCKGPFGIFEEADSIRVKDVQQNVNQSQGRLHVCYLKLKAIYEH